MSAVFLIGCGAVGRSLGAALVAAGGHRVIGAHDPLLDRAAAAHDAEENIQFSQLRNASVIRATAEEAIGRFSRVDAVILDPPRKGCSPELLAELVRLGPRLIVYISCSPPTLARDLALLHTAGYDAVEIQPVDMFPQTSHIETIAKLIPSKSRTD